MNTIDIIEAKSMLQSFFESNLRSDFMTDKDYEHYINAILLSSELSFDILAEQLLQGVENGHSIEYQLKLIKILLVKIKKELND